MIQSEIIRAANLGWEIILTHHIPDEGIFNYYPACDILTHREIGVASDEHPTMGFIMGNKLYVNKLTFNLIKENYDTV